MERLIDEPSLAASSARRLEGGVAEGFSLSRCADNHLRLWSDILGNGCR